MAVRELRLPMDLELLQEVVVECFQYPENPDWGVQADELESIASQLAAVRRMWPLLRLLMALYPGFRDQLAGFVWEEGDRPVGLVLYQPTGLMGGAAWIISTVGVLPSHRRRGIGRRLVERALEDTRDRGVETARLVVLSGNVPAYELYRSLGFERYSASAELALDADVPLPAPVPLPEGYNVRPLGRWEWQPRFRLQNRITPPSVQAYQPLDTKDFYPPLAFRLLTPLLELLGGTANRYVAAYTTSDGEPAAASDSDHIVASCRTLTRTKPGGLNQLIARLDPIAAELAPHLVRRCTGEIEEAAPGRRLVVNVPEWQLALREAALDAGFRVRREAHHLGLKLQRPACRD